MIHELVPWNVLTRTGIPALKVARRPMKLGEATVQVGETLDPELFPLQIRKERLRQFYEARLLEPVNPPVNSRQFYREQRAAQRGDPTTLAEIFRKEEELKPITPVASHIVAGDLPSIEVPVEPDDTPQGKRKPKGAK